MRNLSLVEQNPFIKRIDTYDILGETFWRYNYEDSTRAGLIVVSNSKESGWEEVSIDIDYPTIRCPYFEEMAMFKDIFWDETEVVMQVHPAKKNYVNFHPYTLHLWRNNKTDNEKEQFLRENIIDVYKDAEMILPKPGVTCIKKGGYKTVIINSGDGEKLTWDEVCKVKRKYWRKQEAAVQFNLGEKFDCNNSYIILWDAKRMILP